jgi:hypothetical protein
MCKCILPLGVNPIAVDKYININQYQINAYKIFIEKPKEGYCLEYQSVDIRVIVKYVLKKQGRKMWTRFIFGGGRGCKVGNRVTFL